MTIGHTSANALTAPGRMDPRVQRRTSRVMERLGLTTMSSLASEGHTEIRKWSSLSHGELLWTLNPGG